jgi:hypothetical protein
MESTIHGNTSNLRSLPIDSRSGFSVIAGKVLVDSGLVFRLVILQISPDFTQFLHILQGLKCEVSKSLKNGESILFSN